MPNIGGTTASISDLQFIRQKSLDGDWITVEGDISSVNDKITYTPASGKTFFLYSAKIQPTGYVAPAVRILLSEGSVTSPNQTEAKISIGGSEIDKVTVGYATSISSTVNTGAAEGGTGGDGHGSSQPSYFEVLGEILVGDAIKVVEIENTLDNGSAFAKFSGWIENT